MESSKVITGTFFSYYWYVDEKEKEITSVRVYGLDENNKNICLRIDDFTPYIYLELPVKAANGSNIDWKSKVQSLGDRLDDMLKEHKPIKKKLQFKHKLYGAEIDKDGNKKVFPYLLCSFSNKTDYKNLFYILKKPIYILGVGQIKLKMHEQDASEILQLVSCRDIPTAGWIKFKGKEIIGEEKLTICDKEYVVGYQHLNKFDKNILACPKIMGFDIEVNSTNPSAMPQASKPGDKIFQISCVFSREGESEYDNYLLTLGEVDPELVSDDVNVYMFESEADLLEGFTELVREQNPNIIVGYNILKFDIQYMIDRAKSSATHFCFNDFAKLGFHKDNISNQEKIKWSSSAFKNQEFDYLDAEGRVFVDLLPLIQRDYKFNNYQLKTVSQELLKDTKDDLSPKGIFKCYRIGIQKEKDGTYSKKAIKAMSICGRYCLKDSILVIKLMEKLQAWVGLAEMAKTTNISIFDVFTQGQQKKVYSQIYKYCMYQNIVVEKDAYFTKENERYVGAHVFPPVPGNYERVLPFDFASLYPTTIIAYNIDYSSWVTDPSIPDEKCNVFTWRDCISCIHDPKVIKYNELTKYIDGEKEILKKLREDRDNKSNKYIKQTFIDQLNKKVEELKPYISERSDIKKTISKTPMCEERYYRFLKEPKGVVPTILQNLLDARKNTRKQIKENQKLIEGIDDNKKIRDIDDLNKVLDKRQLAYKISANSMYGILGVKKGLLPFMPGAMVCTYMGRTNIEIVADTITKKYGGKLVYGDSVTGDTPILCKINNKIVYRTIDNLPHFGWTIYKDEKEVANPISIEVWTENGFTKVKNIIRHKTKKEIFRVLIHTGIVDVTEDHGLLDEYGTKISPKDINIGSNLLTHDLPIDCEYKFNDINKDLAFVMGLFYADGSCGSYKRHDNKGYVNTWAINNQDRELLKKCENILNNSPKNTKYEFHNLTYKILETIKSSNVLKLVSAGKNISSFVKVWRELFYDKEKYKKVPDEILWSNKEVRQSFLDGYYAGDGDKDKNGYYRFDNKGKIGAAGLYFLATSLGYNVSINIIKDKNNIYRLTCTKNAQRKQENTVKKIQSLGNTEQYVYDLETENHHFSAGIGKLIVHNTDCVLASEPVLIKTKIFDKNIIEYKTVEELSDGKWQRINPNKEISKAKDGYQIWSDTGFTNIVNVVRCSIIKPLTRILTHVGVVNCSNEHSLLTEDLKSITPLEVKIGDKLCISELPLPNDTPKKPIYNNKLTKELIEEYIIPSFEYEGLTAELAFAWGLFYADGSCGEYMSNTGYTKSTWAINNQDNKLLERTCDILNRNETSLSFKILDTMKSSSVNKLVAKQFSKKIEHKNTIVTFVSKYRNLFYNNRRYKKVPSIIFNSPFEIRQSFFMGYYAGDGSKKDPAISLFNKGAIGSAGLFYLMKSVGYQVSINTREDKVDIFKLTGSTPEIKMRYISNAIKKIIPLESKDNEYIYDIQTENHHFAAGVGQLVVHNSNYITFPHLKNADESWDYALKVSKEVSALFPPPIYLEFEHSIYAQFFILTKKRYLFRSCGRDGIVDKKIGKKGVLLARRDNALIIRLIYEKLISMIFDKISRDDVLYYILEELNRICSNSVPHKEYVITKSVGDVNNMNISEPYKDEKGKMKVKIGNYIAPMLPKNAKEKEKEILKKEAIDEIDYYKKCLPAVVQLAEKMRNRGQRVDVGTRLEYVIVDVGKNKKQYEKIENIDYFLQHNDIIRIDFLEYIRLMINPIDDLLNVGFKKNIQDGYKFKKDFIFDQYKFRSINRKKMLDEIKSLFTPKLMFKN